LGGITVTQPAALTASVVASAIFCNGGTSTLKVSATGGIGPLQYSLNGGAFQLDSIFENVSASPNPYIVTVKDQNNYKVATSITLTQPDKIILSATVNKATCPGQADGSISLSVSGGTAGYTYAWTGANSYASLRQVLPVW
jgi:hypothetical protein